MSFVELVLMAVGLSMDAFAVSIGNGMAIKRIRLRDALPIAVSFGIFQAVMPLIGYFLGSALEDIIKRWDHYIALVFLGYIGGKMIYDGIKELLAGRKKAPADNLEDVPPTATEMVSSGGEHSLSFGKLMIQAVATSIDALIVGVSFAALPDVNIWAAVSLIGAITFVISMIGVFAGKKFGELLGSKAEIFGGAILVAIGVKVFVEHMFFGG